MAFENATLGALLSDPRIAAIAPDAIRARDLRAEPLWDMTLEQLKGEQFFTGEIARGIERGNGITRCTPRRNARRTPPARG